MEEIQKAHATANASTNGAKSLIAVAKKEAATLRGKTIQLEEHIAALERQLCVMRIQASLAAIEVASSQGELEQTLAKSESTTLIRLAAVEAACKQEKKDTEDMYDTRISLLHANEKVRKANEAKTMASFQMDLKVRLAVLEALSEKEKDDMQDSFDTRIALLHAEREERVKNEFRTAAVAQDTIARALASTDQKALTMELSNAKATIAQQTLQMGKDHVAANYKHSEITGMLEVEGLKLESLKQKAHDQHTSYHAFFDELKLKLGAIVKLNSVSTSDPDSWSILTAHVYELVTEFSENGKSTPFLPE
jgi:hypothetical protein